MNRTFMDVYIELRRKEMQKLWDSGCLCISAKELIEEILGMLKKTSEGIKKLKEVYGGEGVRE